MSAGMNWERGEMRGGERLRAMEIFSQFWAGALKIESVG
jgi:hypothetical protein